MKKNIFSNRLKEADIIAKLNDICEENTNTTRCSTAVWDEECNQITERHFCHKICKFYLFNNREIRREYCDKDDLKYARLVVETGTAQTYVCWAGFTCFMVPLIVYDHVIGLISIGEFLTPDHPELTPKFFDVIKQYDVPQQDIEDEILNHVPIFSRSNIDGLVTSTEFLSRVIGDILMGEISLSFDFDQLVKKYISLQPENYKNFSAEELSSFLILKNIIKLQNLFLSYALRKLGEERRINLHKTLHPYQMILTASQNMRTGRDVEHSFKQIVESVKKVEEYTLKSIRTLSLGDSQWLAIREKTEINLREFLSQIIHSKDLILKHKNVDIELDSQNNYFLWGQKTELEFLFLTILENAIHAVNEKNGKIKFSVEKSGETIVICCQDNGCGMTGNDLQRIFNIGYRSKSFMQRNPSGSGLGLVLAKRIAEAHGAELKIDSQVDLGTNVKVIFPTYSIGER